MRAIFFIIGVLFISLLLIGVCILIISGNLVFVNIPILSTPSSISDSGYTVYFSPDVLSVLNNNFVNSGVDEYTVCLGGSLVPYTFNVTSISNFHLGNSFSTPGLSCPYSSLGNLHSHTNKLCYASNSDIQSWHNEINSGETLFIIQCDVNKFMVYTQEHLDRGFIYEI